MLITIILTVLGTLAALWAYDTFLCDEPIESFEEMQWLPLYAVPKGDGWELQAHATWQRDEDRRRQEAAIREACQRFLAGQQIELPFADEN